MSTTEATPIAVFVLPEFNAFDLSATLQSLEELARGTAEERVMLLSSSGGTVASADDVLRVPTERIADCTFPMHLILVGGLSSRLKELGQIAEWIRSVHSRSGQIYAVSSAVFWVAALELLGEARAAVHWSLMPEFKRTYPHIPCSAKTVDGYGSVLTSVGGLGTLDLMLTVIARKQGHHAAKLVADRLALGDRFTRSASQWQIIQRHVRKRVPPLSPVLDLVNSKGGSLSRSDMCKASGLGERQLERLCKRPLGVTPHSLIRKTQLDRARELICNSTMPISLIATEVGFSSLSQFSKRYKEEFGERPRSSRVFANRPETP
jgi:transcriptional regulator GlxA family with amidase domain